MNESLIESVLEPFQHPENQLDSGSEPEFLPLSAPSDRKDWTQAELADLLKMSDRTIRNYLSKLKEIYYWREHELTFPNGRYTPFCANELIKLQQAISPYVAFIVEGETNLVKNSSRMPFDQYREQIWEQENMTRSPVRSCMFQIEIQNGQVVRQDYQIR